jgi:microcin C transport system substrate-binding protein
MTTLTYPGSDLPGNELRDEFSCEASKVQGGANLAGVCSNAIDAPMAKAIAAQDRPPLATAGRALERLLLYGWYMMPNWRNSKFTVAIWNRFGRPDVPIRQGLCSTIRGSTQPLQLKTDAAKWGGN